MTQANAIQHFLSGMTGQANPAAGQPRRTVLPFVTISRQAGAGGHSLAETLVKTMARESDQTLFQGNLCVSNA